MIKKSSLILYIIRTDFTTWVICVLIFQELRNAINALKENIAEKGLKNIVYEKGDDFLARFIRTSKYDVAKAFRMLNGYYLNRASLPHKVAPRGKGPKDTEFYVPLKSIMILDRKNWDGSSVLSM